MKDNKKGYYILEDVKDPCSLHYIIDMYRKLYLIKTGIYEHIEGPLKFTQDKSDDNNHSIDGLEVFWNHILNNGVEDLSSPKNT